MSLIKDWIGKKVHVTLRSTVPVSMEGTLSNADESGIMVEIEKGKTFVPITSILHISMV